ncbi:MAG: sigma-70 family RNA polymerase sigma factor [Patulibacter minatonensis]
MSSEAATPATAPDERYLLRAARRGDLEAFGTLMRHYETTMYRVALRMLGTPADAEDAVQEAMVRAWRSLRRYRGDAALSTWLYRITTNCCLTLIERRRPTTPLDDEHHHDHHPERLDPADRLEQRESMRQLLQAIDGLPPEQRAVVVLRDLEGLSYDEVADVLEVSLAAVKGRLHRARLRLADELEGLR